MPQLDEYLVLLEYVFLPSLLGGLDPLIPLNDPGTLHQQILLSIVPQLLVEVDCILIILLFEPLLFDSDEALDAQVSLLLLSLLNLSPELLGELTELESLLPIAQFLEALILLSLLQIAIM